MTGDPVGSVLVEAVRTRVVALAAQAVGEMPADHLPAALKRVATFAPARRARLAGTQIAAVLESDPTFRGHLAAHVRPALGELGAAVLDGQVPAAADPVEVAAAAYLLRPDGWETLVEQAQQSLTAGSEDDARHAAERADRLQRRVDDLEATLERLRERLGGQVEHLKSENTDLRRKLGETRQRLRAAEEAAQEAVAAQDRDVAAANTERATAEQDVRRLRTRVSELEESLGAARRTERAEKLTEGMRARLLLDTLVDAAQGLRRELGLPAAERRPADAISAHLGQEGTRVSTGRGSRAVDDPALVEELLRLPRAHLIVDGYNVTKSALPELALDRQRERLLSAVAPLVARTGAELTVVFDAADTQVRPLVATPRGVRVLFSPVGVIADDVIRDLIAAEPQGRSVAVVTSDQAVARDVVAEGFRVVASAALAQLVRLG